MAITKKYLKTKPVCKVTFSLSDVTAEKVAVVGDFNSWNPSSFELKKTKTGIFKGTFDIRKDSSYEFKYLIDGNFVADMEADRMQWNDYAGSENSVLVV